MTRVRAPSVAGGKTTTRIACTCVLLSAAHLSSCHLADDIDAPKCEEGFHPELQKCVPDETTERRVTITPALGGTSCTGDSSTERPPVFTPETIQIAVNENFQFDNKDAVDHTIMGDDGSTWVTVKANQSSLFVSIKKAGTWPYHVQGCTKKGFASVE